MKLHIVKQIIITLSWIHHIISISEVIRMSNSGESWCTYEIHRVSESKSYDLVYQGTNPPKRCQVGFWQGLDGETCVEVKEYNINDCDIEINFSSEILKDYSCDNQPSGRKCTRAGEFLKIRVTTKYPRKKSYKYSSFTLHVTAGNVKKDTYSSGGTIIAVLSVGAIVIVIIIVGVVICLKRRNELALRSANQVQGAQPAVQNTVAYHTVRHHGDTSGRLITDQVQVQQYNPPSYHQVSIATNQLQPSSNITGYYGQNQAQQAYGQAQQTDLSNQHTDRNVHDVPPPSYEEAQKFLIKN